MLVDYNTYKIQEFTCLKCGWEGFDDRLDHFDLIEAVFMGDLDCQKCGHIIAFWLAPLSREKDKTGKVIVFPALQ